MNSIIKNLIPYSSFEQKEFEENYIKATGWTNVYAHNSTYTTKVSIDKIDSENNTISTKFGIIDLNRAILCSNRSYDGINSLHIPKGSEIKVIESNSFMFKSNHKYYFSYYSLTTEDTSTNVVIGFKKGTTYLKTNDDTTCIYEIKPSLNKWSKISNIFTSPGDGTGKIAIKRNSNTIVTNDIYLDGLVLVDLTESFGDDAIPSKKWLDDNINYFSDLYSIQQNKDAKISIPDSFIQDDYTKLYYCNDQCVNIKFEIENFDLDYNTNTDKNHKLKLILREQYEVNNHLNHLEDDINNEDDTYSTDTIIYFGDSGFNENNIIDHHDDWTVFSVNLQTNVNSVEKRFQIMCDKSMYNESAVLYTWINWRSTNVYNYLSYDFGKYNDINIDSCNVKLTGEIDPYEKAPSKIDIFVNGVNVRGVKIFKHNIKNCTYEKELFLSPGINKIDFIVVDICGKTIEKSTTLNVVLNPNYVSKVNLLSNFIGNDDNTLSLHTGQLGLQYKDKNAEYNKQLKITTNPLYQFFSLDGDNAKYYRISRENIPEIKADIAKQPIVVLFSSVEKIYDGTNDITNAMKDVISNNGFKFVALNESINNYVNSRFVNNSYEQKSIQEIIFNKNDQINSLNNKYVIDTNINLSNTFKILIDGNIGYYDTNTNSFKFENDCTDFKSISIDFINNQIVITFNLLDDEVVHTVKELISISYNYNGKTNEDSKYNFRISDENKVSVDFDNAYFDTTDVSGEWIPIHFDGLKLVGGSNGDESNNYVLTNYSAYGRIKKRQINVEIIPKNKVYDGSNKLPFDYSILGLYSNKVEKMDANDGSIEYYVDDITKEIVYKEDDVYIDNTYLGTPSENYHIFMKTGPTWIEAKTPDAGLQKDIYNINKNNDIILSGSDVKNYYINSVSYSDNAQIFKRDIMLNIYTLRYIRSSNTFEIEYEFLNDIKQDNLRICFSNDSSQASDMIKVYGGTSIGNNENICDSVFNKEIADIEFLTIDKLFFGYSTNLNYKFKIKDQIKVDKDAYGEVSEYFEKNEVYRVEDTDMYYYHDEVRPAEPGNLRIDAKPIVNYITDSYNNKYKDIKFSKKSEPYFESSDKKYRIRSGDEVLVKNINLDRNNPKSSNYNLLTTQQKIKIEII